MTCTNTGVDGWTTTTWRFDFRADALYFRQWDKKKQRTKASALILNLHQHNTLTMEDKQASTTSTDNNSEEPNLNHLEAATATAATTDQVEDDDEDDDWKIQRDESKAAGDAAFRETDYTTAIHHYSAALSVDPDNATLLSNRSAAYLKSSQKSKALHDAQACVRIGTMGYKGHSRLAAALQSLGRYEQALESWKLILKQDPNNQAAPKGIQDCQAAAKEKAAAAAAAAAAEEEAAAAEEAESALPDDKDDQPEEEVDDLDDFFNDVDVVSSTVAKEKEELAIEKPAVATNRIATHKKDLGTAADQIERLLQENYKWRNLNPFHILDVPHTASSDDISRRFKALSLLVSPTAYVSARYTLLLAK
jgi:tetratricopeptide (TPR) repeat protein